MFSLKRNNMYKKAYNKNNGGFKKTCPTIGCDGDGNLNPEEFST